MVDWLDVGFNLVIGAVIVGIILYAAWNVWSKIKYQLDKDNEEELNNLMQIEKRK